MAENQGEAGGTEQVVHRRPPRRCAARSSFTGMATSFATPRGEAFHWYVLSDLDEVECLVELLDDELGADDA